MLKIFNNLKPFIEDCYEERSVREYSSMTGVSPPTSSKMLKQFEEEGILQKREYRNNLLFRANRESYLLKDLSRIYWKQELKELFDFLKEEFHYPSIVLFGSLSKLESKDNSDIDIVIFTKLKKKVKLQKYEKRFNRDIQLFRFDNLEKINKELRLSIMNGYLVFGELK